MSDENRTGTPLIVRLTALNSDARIVMMTIER